MSHSLYVVTYDRGRDYLGHIKPYHWSFFIDTDGILDSGIEHQLRGMPGGFYYVGAEPVQLLDTSNSMKNKLHIGEIPVTEVGSVEDMLTAVPIVKDEASDWNCQSWSGSALGLMAEKGWVMEGYTFAVLKAWLKEMD